MHRVFHDFAVERRFPDDAEFRLNDLQSDSEPAVLQDDLLLVLYIHILIEVGDEHDRKLETLARVDRHDAHEVLVFAHGPDFSLVAPLPVPFQVADEIEYADQARLLELRRFFDEFVQVREPLVAARQCVHEEQESGLPEHRPKQHGEFHFTGEYPEPLQRGEKTLQFFRSRIRFAVRVFFQHRQVRRPGLPFRSRHHPGKVFRRKPDDRRTKHRRQRHFVVRIVNDRQIMHGELHLERLVETGLPLHV